MHPETVLSEAVEAFNDALGERLSAAYALGSLAHGGFSPLVSDVDLGLIVADPPRSDDDATIERVAESVKARGSELHERLSVFWGTTSTLRGEREGGRFPPLDRLDLIENGRLLAGTDERSGLPRPTAQELLIAGAEFALGCLAGMGGDAGQAAKRLGSMRPAAADAVEEIRSPEKLVSRGVRRLTKLVLFPVRFLYSAETGRVGTNEAAVAHYVKSDWPSGLLVAAALRWRGSPPTDEIATPLLREHMASLYAHYIDDHISRLGALGESELASRFEAWRNRLTR
jgi:predicted nucleotidyltransferase